MIQVTKAYLPNKEKLLGYIDNIYTSCQLTNNGPLLQELETRLANYLGIRHLILVANGTLALQIAYKALNVQGSAITTPFSFPATTSSLVWEGIKPIFVDIHPRTWNIDSEKIEVLISPDTSAIVSTHIFGNPCDVETIQEIAKHYNLKVIYDGAHAFDVKYKSETILHWGDITTLSFHATKLFHTIEGGAIATSDDDLAKRIRLLINFGIENPGNVVEVGINAKLNEFEAAMGLCVLDEIEGIHQKRRSIWQNYNNYLENVLTFQVRRQFSTNNYSHCPVLFKNEEMVKKVQKKLANQSIFPRRYFYPSLDLLPYIKEKKHMVCARDIASRILCLPLYPELEISMVKKICNIILLEIDSLLVDQCSVC